MSADPETLLFARFRDGADVGALGELYDRTAAELLRVAFHLVRDPARAEDLVQQTFVAAIEGAVRFDATRAVRAWLLGILANQARKLQRDEARVPPGGSEPSIDPLAVAQTEEFTAQVDAAISTLPEVYQPVLVLHLKHGMIAAEIAHALRRPPGTVRTQLMRALELLKKALPASIALGAGVLLMPLRGLAAVKQVVLANAVSHVAAGVAVGAGVGVGVASLVGGTVAMKKLVAALVLAVLICAGAFAWFELDRPVDANTGERDASSLVQAALQAPDAPPAAAAAPVATEREQLVAPTHGSLRYRFLWQEDRTPAIGVFAHCVVWGRQNPAFSAIDTPTDQNGEIALQGLEPGKVGIYVDRAGVVAPQILAGEESTGTYLIPRGVTVDVSVQDEQRQPIAGARVLLSDGGGSAHEVGVTNATGRVTIRDVGEGRDVAARADSYAPTDPLDIKGKAGERVAVTLTMTAGGASLRGTVRDAEGHPVPGARVRLGDFALTRMTSRGPEEGASAPPFELFTDASGFFHARGLPPGSVRLQARAAGSGTALQKVALRAGETSQVDVTLPAGGTVAGFVRDEEGRGIAGAWVGGGADFGDFAYCSTASAADGSFTLEGLSPRADLPLGASLEPFLPCRYQIALAEGERRTTDFVLPRSLPKDQISGQLVDEHGTPLAKWIVNIRPEEMFPQWWAYLTTDEQGRFVARNCPDRECVLEVFDPVSRGGPYALVSMRPVKRGMSDLLVRVPAAALHFGSFVGKVVDADGRPVRDADVSVRDPAVPTYRSWSTDAGGCFRVERLPVRTYHLDVSAEGHPTVRLGERTLEAKEELDVGTIVLPRGGRLELACSGVTRPGWLSAVVQTESGEFGDAFDENSDPMRSGLLAPGRYQLRLCGQGIATSSRDVEITDGQTTKLEVALERGAVHSIAIREPKPGPWRRMDIAVTDAQGRPIWDVFFDRRGNEGDSSTAICLGVGTWHVQAKTDTGLTGTTTIHVADVTIEPAPVVVELR